MLAAIEYSWNGLRRILREAAFRQEVILGVAALGILLLIRADLAGVVLFAVVFCLLLAVEAINTAIEEVVDHLSPEWTQFGKNAKDLGSFAVACAILAAAIAFLWAALG